MTDSEDRIQDSILTVGKCLLKLLKGNIESLQLPAVLKNVLKRLKSFLSLIDNKIEKDDSNKMITRIVSDQRQRQFQRRQAAAPHKRVRFGVKSIEGTVCNKTFKIKQFIVVPKNIQVNKMDKLFEE